MFQRERLYWNRKAAINGYAEYNLANYYLVNEYERKSFKWYLKLANKMSLEAIRLVADCYKNDIGTDKDLSEAAKWLDKYCEKVNCFM